MFHLLGERSRTTSDIGNRERTRTVSDIGPRERTFSASDVEVELDGCAGSYFCHPQKFGHRYGMSIHFIQ